MACEMKAIKFYGELLLFTIAINATISNGADAHIDEFPAQQQHQILPISNILFEAFIPNAARAGGSLTCLGEGEHCWTECCPGLTCKFLGTNSFCGWCPSAGDPCGALDHCCDGYSCDGFFSGTCH
ncbi:hypothetical protein SOVF_015660 [Spinacia oleracea]|nr:hypothetical protein SOVF_015660 [Spinacia oleracea]